MLVLSETGWGVGYFCVLGCVFGFGCGWRFWVGGFVGFVVAVLLFFVLLVLELVVGVTIAAGCRLGFWFLNAVYVNLVICVLGLVYLWLVGLRCIGCGVVLA